MLLNLNLLNEFFFNNSIPKPSIIDTDKILKYIHYYNLWNSKINLSSIRNEKDIVEKHFLDSFSLNYYLTQNTIVDIGSGAGFPGLAYCLINEKIDLWSIEKDRKKINFQQRVAAEIKIKNIYFFEGELQCFNPPAKIDYYILRAVEKKERIFEWLSKNLNTSKCIYMAAENKKCELFQYGLRVEDEFVYQLPFSKQKHKLMVICKKNRHCAAQKVSRGTI